MNRHRRIAVLAGTVGIAVVFLAVLVVARLSHEVEQHVANPSTTGSAPSPLRSDRAGSPSFGPDPGAPEFSPTTEAPLWPVPTFTDGCGPQDRPSADLGISSADRECAMASSPPRPHAGHRQYEMELVALAALLGLAVAIAATYLLLRRRSAEKARRADQLRRWRTASAILDDIASEIMAFELDPQAPCARPLLGDVTEPATADFYKAYAAAHDLRTSGIPCDEEAIRAFAAAVTHARRAFDAADLNARSKAGGFARQAQGPSSPW